MTSPRVLHLSLDACDLHLATALAAEGRMPTLARLLEEGAVVETVAPPGVFALGGWIANATGQDIARTRYFCSLQVDGAPTTVDT